MMSQAWFKGTAQGRWPAANGLWPGMLSPNWSRLRRPLASAAFRARQQQPASPRGDPASTAHSARTAVCASPGRYWLKPRRTSRSPAPLARFSLSGWTPRRRSLLLRAPINAGVADTRNDCFAQLNGTFCASSASQTSALPSDGARQSPRGDSEPPEEIFGPFGSADRLN